MPERERHDAWAHALEQSFTAPRSLSPEAHARLRDHIRSCDRCRAAHARFAALEHGLHREPAALSSGQIERGLAALKTARPQPKRRPALLAAGAAALAASALLVVLPAVGGRVVEEDDAWTARGGGELAQDPAFRLRILRIRGGAITDAEGVQLEPGDVLAVMASAPAGLRELELRAQTRSGERVEQPKVDGNGFEGRRLALLPIETEADVPERVQLRFQLADGRVVKREVRLP